LHSCHVDVIDNKELKEYGIMFIPSFMEIISCLGGDGLSYMGKYAHIIELPFLRNESEFSIV
jgi:hypothetical protein